MPKQKANSLLPVELIREVNALWTHTDKKTKEVFFGKVRKKERWIILSMAVLAMLELSSDEMDHYIEEILHADRKGIFAELVERAKSGKLLDGHLAGHYLRLRLPTDLWTEIEKVSQKMGIEPRVSVINMIREKTAEHAEKIKKKEAEKEQRVAREKGLGDTAADHFKPKKEDSVEQKKRA